MSSWIIHSPSSGIGDGTVFVTATTFSGSENREETLAVYEGRFYNMSGKTDLHQLYNQVTAITVDALWVTDVDYYGGEATYLNCTSTVYAFYANGTSGMVYDKIILTNEELLVEENDGSSRRECGELTINAYYGGVSASTTVTAYQEGNPKYDYLTFEILTGGTLIYSWDGAGSTPISTTPLYYSINNSEWQICENSMPTSSITVSTGDIVRWKAHQYAPNIGFFNSTAYFNVRGNFSSIAYWEDFATTDRTAYGIYHFFSLVDEYTYFGSYAKIISCEYLYLKATDIKYGFAGIDTLITAPKYLPNKFVMELGYSCAFYNCKNMVNGVKRMDAEETVIGGEFRQMFEGCSSMTNTFSELKVRQIQEVGCYLMYKGCSSLQKPPKILAEEVGKQGFDGMFLYCSSLTEAPELPIVKLGVTNQYGTFVQARNCYRQMFYGCSSLVKAPTILPATALTQGCYSGMFSGCTSLKKAPIIKAEQLDKNSCSHMFDGCVNLTETPFLWAETPSESAYTGMFSGCSRVDEVNCMVRITGPSNRSCIYGMLDGVKNTGKLKTNKKCYNGEHGWQSSFVGTHYKAPSGWTETIVELF